MIEFKGELSHECKKYLQKYSSKRAGLVSWFLALAVGIIVCLLALLVHWVVIFFIIVPVLVAIFASTPRLNSPLKVLNKLIPKRVIIENGMIEFLCDEGSQWDYLENIKNIFDCGEWYHIIFNYPAKSIYCVCQKNLLTEGSIEQFEKLFEGKIVRKK